MGAPLQSRSNLLRAQLLAGASALAIIVSTPAAATDSATMHAIVNTTNAAIIANPALQKAPPPRPTQGMQTATERAIQYQAHLSAGLDLAQQAQEAARAAAQALQSSVPDGLGAGGLDPVGNPLPASQDSTGLLTWEGASAPTQTTDGSNVNVTINQTQSRAVLSWQTFNIGKNTTLTFSQKQNGTPQSDWVALNRVVGQLDPTTGLRDAGSAPAPSQILGSIKADGTVLVINQNGILFSGTSQINVHSLIATSLEIGRALDDNANPLSIAQRNSEFLNFGLLGFADQASINELPSAFTFSAQATSRTAIDPLLEGTIEVDAGAQINSADQGFILLTGPKIVNAGQISSPDGQVSLVSGREITLQRSQGGASSIDPNVRGFVINTLNRNEAAGNYVDNTLVGIIDAPRGYVSLQSTQNGAVSDAGLLESTTSVSRNGFIRLDGGDIQLTPQSILSITPDTDGQTIPQDPVSLADFKPSKIDIGSASSRIEMDGGAMIYAPSADVTMGADAGLATVPDANPGDSRIFIDTGAVIDVAGLTDVLIPASRNSIAISPVKGNELRDDPNYRNSFLNGATVYVDPRLSGVRSDGVAWVGSPLIEAGSFAQQVGVSAAELMTKGGNLTLGVSSFSGGNALLAPDVIVKAGAQIDISGGWVDYQAGMVQQTRLIDANGQVVDISNADPNDTYVGIFQGFTNNQARWGVSQSWNNPLLQNNHYEGAYTEGRDAGSLVVKSSAIALDGTIYASAFPGSKQLSDAQLGTAPSSLFGDERKLQGAPSQLPSGGFLDLQALGTDPTGNITGGADFAIVGAAEYQPLDSGLAYGQSISFDANGNLIVPTRDPVSLLPADRQSTIVLSADALSAMGLGQLSLATTGKVDVAQDANVALTPGGIFDALAGRAITVEGSITAPSGTINLQTAQLARGNVFAQDNPVLGSYDIVVDGTLSTRGLWVNDFGATPDSLQGDAYLNGGTINLMVAPRATISAQTASVDDTLAHKAPAINTDISGSVLINSGALVDVSGGGYVTPQGTFELNSKGGNLSLIDETNYFQLADDANKNPGGIEGFRVTTIKNGGGNSVIAVNPDAIDSRVSIGGTILANGFSGGGTFTLTTPQFDFGTDSTAIGTQLPMDFFSNAGFANYNITSYKTDLVANDFSNKLGGYNAVLATQILDVGAGQTLSLTQSMFNPLLDNDQMAALRNLQSGGDLYSVLTPSVPGDAWDRRAVSLTLGGLIELKVEQGGSITGDAGAHLTVSQLYNEGNIRLVGGTITQSEVLPSIYAGTSAIGVHQLSDIFSYRANGKIDEDAPNAMGLRGASGVLSNGDVAAQKAIYLLGDLDQGEGVRLAPGSVTDLSGASIRNPRAKTLGGGGFTSVVDGRVVAGGTLESLSASLLSTPLFHNQLGQSVITSQHPTGTRAAEALNADPGSVIDVSGASDTFDRLSGGNDLAPVAMWSDAGTLALGNGGTITGATIHAQGGAPDALGGTLLMLDPVLSQDDPSAPAANAISASAIGNAGFDTFVAQGSINSSGDVSLSLRRGFFLTSRPYGGLAGEDLNNTLVRDNFAPVVRAGGALQIAAPYIAFDSDLQAISSPLGGTPGPYTVTFQAEDIDFRGAILFDRSLATVNLIASGNVRLTGVEPWQETFNVGANTVANSLAGELLVNGDLNITAGQVYPTTGSSFIIASTAADGTIGFARAGGDTPSTPYSAGGNLLVQAANIVQGGVIRVPVGSLTLGSATPLVLTTDSVTNTFAPATQSVELTDGSITSVSANGLVIPYGTTTDQIEWFFSPTGASELSAPPAAQLHMGGTNVSLDSGATVDVSGGGDLYAYEFVPGTGGSHDLLSRFNTDDFSSNNGLQFADGRQVYAIVPGLSGNDVAAFDPIYSSDYGDLYSASHAGERVYLDGGQGVAAGWYTLLPAQYAMLPGGMRIVQDSGTSPVAPNSSTVLKDGTRAISGYYGVAGANSRESDVVVFDVQPQSVFLNYSDIALTSADMKFAADAAHNGTAVPRLPVDAGRLVLAPSQVLAINTVLTTTPGDGGRGAEADLSGQAFEIVSTPGQSAPAGTIELTADSLTNLNASSLLIGGVRTDNADGTTTLDITADSIVVANDSAHPLTAPSTILAVDGSNSNITLMDGATITASGSGGSDITGNFIIDGSTPGMTGQGAILRVSSGPQRGVTRQNIDPGTAAGSLDVGAADLEGSSILLNSSGDMGVSPNATIHADALGLGAGQVTFTSDPTGLSGLVITPTLQALFANAEQLSIQTPNAIVFSDGSYTFGDLALDTPGLSLRDGANVTIHAGDLQLANSGADAGACGQGSAAACGTGNLVIDASEIDFGSGTLHTYGFGNGTTLAATDAMYIQGDAVFDAGPGALALQTPFIGDSALTLLPGQDALIPSLSFTTTGAVTISNPGGGTAPTASGTLGASLSINGNSIDVSGTTLRATAGTLDLNSATGINVSDGAMLETPGYSKMFGDAADPVTVSAPGGALTLSALNGDIDIASGTTLSVGGGEGQAGTLSLIAANGAVNLGGTIDANAPDGGGSFILDTGGAFDLNNFASAFAPHFDGTIAIRSGTGDLSLASGDTLKANNVQLIADGGAVDIAGAIDVSGTTGGEADLFGSTGVTLEGTSFIDAHANGYADSDTRQAKGGTVNIGTDGAGIINVASGASIDVGARRSGDRLVPMTRDGTVYYTYVPADMGGTVAFRAPVVTSAGHDTVNVFYAGNIAGADSIVLEGFRKFDLASIAADPNFTGVTINGAGQAVLDVSASASGKENFLGDNAPGTLVQFVQDFDISGANGHLGNLASSANFHERPGMELDYSGDIVLNSNWNLGAGVVDVAGAVAAGLMAPVPSVPGKFYVLPGKEAQLFAQFTRLIYRTRGAVDGEPGMLTMRAGGNLKINGSITDGFFQFADQTDPDYLNIALGGGNQIYKAGLVPNCFGGSCSKVGQWAPGALLGSYVSVNIPSAGGLQGILENPAPYSAAANSPAALGSLAGGTGDPLGSAELFPLIGNQPVGSWSYTLVGGSDLGSVDTARAMPGVSGNVTVAGEKSYTYSAVKGTSVFSDTLLLQAGQQFVSASDWLAQYLNANPGLDSNSFTFINFTSAPATVRAFLSGEAASYFASHAGQYQLQGPAGAPTGVTTTLSLASQFLNDAFAANFGTLSANFTAPHPSVVTRPTTATWRTLVRTGSGDIVVSAAANIDLTNGGPVYRNLSGATATPANGGLQVGGTAIYTAGVRADLTPRVVTDTLTGVTRTLDASADSATTDFFAAPPQNGYRYGAGGNPDFLGAGYSGILIADPVYAQDGGDVSLSAGNDVLGRRDIWEEARLSKYFNASSSFGYTWIGASDQAWRTGEIGDITNVRIDPQLFGEGIGALGGGNINVSAGRDISDISIVSDTSVTTADLGGSNSAQALWTMGGGNVDVAAGRNLKGGRIDVASGAASISAGGSIESAGIIQISDQHAKQANDLRLRVSDAVAGLKAGLTVELQGVAALGVQQASNQVQNNLDARGFYSADAGVSILANGSVTLDNSGPDLVTSPGPWTQSTSSAVYPGSFGATSMTGDLHLVTLENTFNQADAIILYPSPTGDLNLYAGGDIAPTTIAMEDGDPGILPGVFSIFQANAVDGVVAGRTFLFPGVLPDTSDVLRRALHNQNPTHAGDPNPARIYAGGDITDMIVSLPKQARIGAGQDLINMMFVGQNLSASDITRIAAGRDIIATTALERPVIAASGALGQPLATLQGNTFVIGGPGSFFLEAGRDAGPFLNSAITDGFAVNGSSFRADGTQTYGGGIQSVGNEWNPWLPEQGSDLYVEFGVGKGAAFDSFRDYYLDPANVANLDGDLFVQVKDANGTLVPDRSQPIYAPILIDWMKTNEAAALAAAYGTTDVSYQQAYDAFTALPELTQRVFMLDHVYFNELIETSDPNGPSFKQYSRGYRAVNTLFPSSLGYTDNDLSGGSNGANQLVETGNLDLRLATIQTTRGGNVYILGPGGGVLAGSTVRTSDQAARRAYDGGRLFAGNVNNVPLIAPINAIPVGDEGILTLRGGSIYTFTDQNFLLNQSRLFTEAGGDIAMWSSNGDLNAGQGPKTSANFPPVVVRIDEDLYSELDAVGGVSGAGIGAFQPDPNGQAPDVFLIAPRGTVDAGDAGVRVAGNLFIAALSVTNANNFSVGGTSSGITAGAGIDVGTQTSASAASAAAAQAAQTVAQTRNTNDQSVITVDVEGYAGGDESQCPDDDKTCKKK